MILDSENGGGFELLVDETGHLVEVDDPGGCDDIGWVLALFMVVDDL